MEYHVQKHFETKSRLQAVSLKGECQSTFLIPLCLPTNTLGCLGQILPGVQDKYDWVSRTLPMSSNQDYSGIRCWPVILKTSVNSYICVCIDLTKHIPPTLYRPHMPHMQYWEIDTYCKSALKRWSRSHPPPQGS